MTLVSISAIIAIVLLTAAFTFAWFLCRAAAVADVALQALSELDEPAADSDAAGSPSRPAGTLAG
jgi:hypothetical protein